MLIIHGHYKWARRPVAFRNGYCHACKACNRLVQYRYFLVGHLFGIPVLPLGFWREWWCTACNSDAAPEVRRPYLWILLGLLVFGAIGGWMIPLDPKELAVSWFMRLGLPICTGLLFWHMRRPQKITDQCPPAKELSCPFCHGAMIAGIPPHCSECGAKQL